MNAGLGKDTLSIQHTSEYYKYAFIQHTCSFSPMLDFTREERIAGTFALKKKENDSKIYMLSFENDDLIVSDEKEAGRILCHDTEIYYVNSKKIRFGQTLFFENSGKTIELTKIDSIIELLTPKPTIIHIPTNDRMRKQKGVFLLLRNCLALKGIIHFELCVDLVIREFIIPADKKDGIRKKLQQEYPQYSWESLMNPYLGFEKISV